MVGRIFVWLLTVLALFLAGRDVVLWIDTGVLRPTPLGQVWYAIHPGSLNLVQAVIERYVHPFLWDPIIFGVLQWPAAIDVAALALFVALARLALRRLVGRRRRGRAPIFRK